MQLAQLVQVTDSVSLLRPMNPIASRISVTPFIPADYHGKVEFSVLE